LSNDWFEVVVDVKDFGTVSIEETGNQTANPGQCMQQIYQFNS